MRLSLSTLFLIVTTICIAAGWYVDRRSNDRQIESLLSGSFTYNSANQAILAASAYDQSAEAVLESKKNGHIQRIFYLYRNSTDVNAYLQREAPHHTARGTAKTLLKYMDCESTDAYFRRFNDIYIYGDDHRHQDAGTAENEAFRLFIDSMMLELKEKDGGASA